MLLRRRKKICKVDLKTTQSSLEELQMQNALLQDARNLAEATLKEALEEATKTEELLTLAEERYNNSERAYKVLMEKKVVPSKALTLATPSPQTPTSEELKKIRKLLSNSQEENANLIEQVQTQEKELCEVQKEL